MKLARKFTKKDCEFWQIKEILIFNFKKKLSIYFGKLKKLLLKNIVKHGKIVFNCY